MALNPNSDRADIEAYPTKRIEDQVKCYPLFFQEVNIGDFRHLHNVSVRFEYPVTVISGTNRTGKTSLLMTIACSHYNFDRQDVVSGEIHRATWSDVVRFTSHDSQSVDWLYTVTYREGKKSTPLQGRRRRSTRKWSGVAKKEGQIGHPTKAHPDGGRHVCLLDVNRITPARHLSKGVYRKAKGAHRTAIAGGAQLKEYLSYILEISYSDVDHLIQHADSKVYCISTDDHKSYSSFNTASGEDVLINLLDQILNMLENSLVLIDEIEIGLHPKIQRRLIDVLYMISRKRHIQFIVVSHSYAVIDSVTQNARVFINNDGGKTTVMRALSTYETLTRMDSHAFPCLELYVEDEVSRWIVEKAVSELNAVEHGLNRLVKIYETGSADKTYGCFKSQQLLISAGKQCARPACILDGDMQNKKSGTVLKYPPELDLFFHFEDKAPEKMLVEKYLKSYSNETMRFHVNNSDVHCLFAKMIENGLAINKKDAFERTFFCYRNDPEGCVHFEQLKNFIRGKI